VLREYDRLAPDYDRRWSFYVDATLRETLRRFELRPGQRLLDVGCGTGALLERLARSVPGAELSGVDASARMLAVARRRLGEDVHLARSGAEALPFPDRAFDCVVSTNALHYFPDAKRALDEMTRVLRPGGILVITDWCHDDLACRLCALWLRAVGRAHVRTYGRGELRRLLERAGVAVARLDRYRVDWIWGLMTAVGQRR